MNGRPQDMHVHTNVYSIDNDDVSPKKVNDLASIF